MAFGRGRQRGKIRNEPNRDPPHRDLVSEAGGSGA